jgi:hypothetical protein
MAWRAGAQQKVFVGLDALMRLALGGSKSAGGQPFCATMVTIDKVC